jgi:serine phosphatase RsbU (regulator of sigma subunit)
LSGDTVYWKRFEHQLLLLLADGIGHGYRAHLASMSVREQLVEMPFEDPAVMLEKVDRAIRPNPGVSACLALVDLNSGQLQCAGVGNVLACIIGVKDMKIMSRDGMLGQNMRRAQSKDVQLHASDRFLMASDGVSERVYQGGNRRRLSMAPECAVDYVIQDYGKDHDDASCLIFGLGR